MMVLFSQVVCLLMIIILGLYIYKKYPVHFQLKSMILVSMFVVIALMLSYVSLMIPLFGFPSLKLSFSQIPLMCIGIVFGPGYAFLSGVIYDVLGLIITPTTFPFLGFTLNNILVSVIPALWFKHTFDKRQVEYFTIMVSVIVSLVFLIYVWTYTDSSAFIEKYMQLSTKMKFGFTIGFLLFVSIILVSMIIWIRKKEDVLLLNWVVCLVFIEVILHLALSPLWLEIMYGIPYMINLFVRIIKSVVAVPLLTVVGLPILNVIKRLYKDV